MRMKYDNCEIIQTQAKENNSVIIEQTKKRKIELLDIFIVQAAVCVIVSIGIIISKIL